MSRSGQAEVTLPFLPTAQMAWLCLADELWRDTTSRMFVPSLFFLSPKSQSDKKCTTVLNSADGSRLPYKLARLHTVTHSSEHLKDPHCQDGGVAARTASCSECQRREEHKQRHKLAQTWFTAHTLEWVSPVIADNRALKLLGTCSTNQSKQGFQGNMCVQRDCFL